MLFGTVIAATCFALMLTVLIRGRQNGAWGTYPLFFAYLSISAALTLTTMLVLYRFGDVSRTYTYFYYSQLTLEILLQLAVLIWIRKVIVEAASGSAEQSRQFWRFLMMGLALLSPIVFTMVTSYDPFAYKKVEGILFPIGMVMCVLVYRAAVRNRTLIDPGRNLRGLLLGLSFNAAVNSLSIVYVVTSVTVPESQQGLIGLFSQMQQVVCIPVMAIFVIAMWRFDPPRFLGGGEPPVGERMKRNLIDAVRLLSGGSRRR